MVWQMFDHVTFHISFPIKAFLTIFAFVGFLSSMY